MLRHLLRLAWNQKRSHALIMVEMTISFLVVFTLAAAGLYFGGHYRTPLGFDRENVWLIDIDRSREDSTSPAPTGEGVLGQRLIDGLRGLDGVIAAAGASTGPYVSSVRITSWGFEGRSLLAETARGSDDLPATLGLHLVEGRWFGPQDDGLGWEPVVLNHRFAASVFGDESPLGRTISAPSKPGAPEWRVVGVVDDFRRGGEFDPPGDFLFQRLTAASPGDETLGLLLARVAPGTTAALEPVLLERLQAIAPEWTFRLTTVDEMRNRYLLKFVAVLAAAGAIAGFLILMVMLGLTGVLWQNVTRRTREIGLRRAAGASRVQVLGQIVGEVMITTGLALIVGVALVAQILVLGPFDFLPRSTTLGAFGLALGFLFLLAALCGLYPGWSATRVPPAVALHHE